MKVLFADTFYYLALLNPHDVAHRQAVALSQTLKAHTVTTVWVITEVGDACASSSQRRSFLVFLDGIRSSSTVTVIPPSMELFDAGITLFSRRPDKDWSLTDCISFVVMDRMGLTEALTADRHFQQAGFVPLLA
jgi:hypothetical protein